MMFLSNRLFLIIFLIGFIVSCEYELDKENYVEIEPPDPFHPIDLNLLTEEDTIIIFRTTTLNYNVNTFGLNILKGEFKLGTKTWDTGSDIGRITISPEEFSPGFDTLSFTVYTNSGTGSLADRAGAEGYVAEKKWLVLLDRRRASSITPTKSITEDGYLKISWPKCNQYNFISYQVTSSKFIDKTICDADSNYYIDSSYIGGPITFRINLIVDHEEGSHAWGEVYEFNDPVPAIVFTEYGIDSLGISWNKSKYNCRYKLLRTDVNPDTTLLFSATDTICIIEQPGFAQISDFILYTEPDRLRSATDTYYYVKQDNKRYVLGKYIASNWPEFGYNHMDRVLYTSTYDDMECYDIGSLSLINSVPIDGLIYDAKYACATNSTKIATIARGKIYVYPDKSLSNPTILNCASNGVDYLGLTNNDLVAVAYPNKYQLISISQNKVVAGIDIGDYPVYSKWACFSTSDDGKYSCIVTYNGIKLYQVNDTVVTPLYTDTRAYRSVLFNENNPEQLFLTFKNSNLLEIRNAADFGLVKTISLPTTAEVIRNIDPASGYLLLTDYVFLYILDINTSEIVFRIRCSRSEYNPKLYGNKLFSVCGYSLDISKYLPE